MPTFPYVEQRNSMVRGDPLGPTLVNQAHANIAAIDDIARIEHFSSGKHNALEVPWVLGHMTDAATPVAYLFDTAYGGTTLGRPATGCYTVSIVAGVIPSDSAGNLLASTIANVADSGIEAKPHTITTEYVSATSLQLRVRELSSGLGAGNAWADVNRNIDVGLHAPPQTASVSLLSSPLLKQRRDYLTEQATDYSALVVNQGRVRKAALVEHTGAGVHLANRIAKGVAWVRWNGAAYVIDASQGVKVAGCSRISTGIYEVKMDDNFTSLNTMACFPEVQPATTSELVIINGRGFGTGTGTSTFRFFIYAYSGGNWARADRTFFASMFGVIA